jgi:hypothetical protein
MVEQKLVAMEQQAVVVQVLLVLELLVPLVVLVEQELQTRFQVHL